MIHWHYKTFQQLTAAEIYEILQLRQAVFVIEQQCIYPDIDGADMLGSHLFTRDKDKHICGYLRILAPNAESAYVKIGRVLVTESARGGGLGAALMRQALSVVEAEYPNHGIKISAQHHLERFYNELGFETVSEPYDEDGIIHIDMLHA